MELKEFLSVLYPEFDKNIHRINIRPFYIYTQKPQYTKFCTTILEICSHAETVQAWNRHNIFFECAELHAEAKNGQEENCLQWPFLYADLDPCKKNISGEIIKTSTKEELLEQVKAFPLRPSIVVDSGRGFHLYWLLEQPLTDKTLVKTLLNTICENLGADKKATLLTQLLRLPGTKNHKTSPPADVCVVDYFPRRYSLDEMQKIIQNHVKPSPKKNLDRQITVKSFQDLLVAVKQQNILSILPLGSTALGQSFNCLFHEDDNPSAVVYHNTDTGFFSYKCFGCGRYMDIVQVYSEINNATFFHSVYALAKQFDIIHEHSEWITKQYEKYHQNAIFIEEFDTYGYDKLYPSLYKFLYELRGGGRLQHLSLLSHFALAKLSTEECQFGGESLFFFSYEYFSKKYNLCSATLKNCITLFAILGFINKVPIEKIPPAFAQKALEQNEKKKKLYSLRKCSPVNFYTIPHFFGVMAEAESRMNYLNRHNYKIKTCTNKAFLIRIGWTSLAHQVFPDERTITQKSIQIAGHLEKTLKKLVTTQGYATKTQVIEKTVLPKSCYAKSTRKQRELGRFFSSFMDTNNFQCIRAKKEHAEKFKLRGYPQIIIPQ